MPQSSEKRRASVGVLFWIAFILLVLVVFLANRSNIERVLESTGIVDVVRERIARDRPQAEDQEVPVTPTPVTPAPRADDAPRRDDPPRVVIDDTESGSPGGDGGSTTTEPPSPSRPIVSAPTDPGTQTRPGTTAQRAPSPDPARPNRLMAGLYFIKVTDDGRTFPQRIVRPVYYATSPLTETIQALIAGPSSTELDSGLLNLIPDGTKLISAHVQNGVAYLNFNQPFRFNPLGAEGTVAQLLQIIYSSTEFPIVQQVQFLVEGERVDYLGGDGIFVGEPLGRDAFSS